MALGYVAIETVVGLLWVAQRGAAVCLSRIGGDEAGFRAYCLRKLGQPAEPDAARELSADLQAHLRGEACLRFDLAGCSSFQRQVLGAIASIPRGQTRTYAQVAAGVGRPRAARAVGQALRANPIPVLIPCHRVVRTDGDLGGYTPEPSVKARLLAWEGS